MKSKKTPAPRRAGNESAAAGLTRLFDALGDNPARMVACLEMMDRALAKRRSRRRSRKY